MLQTKLKLDTLERFLSKEKAEKMRYGMRNFMIVCLRTMERKKKFRLLRAFNRIFSYVSSCCSKINTLTLECTHRYGLAQINERNRAIIEKSKHVLNFVRKLRHEIVEDDEEENSKHHDAFPRTPMERPMSVSPKVRRSRYRSHQHPQPPPIPHSAMLDRERGFAARHMRGVVERWLLRTAFTTWTQNLASPRKKKKKKVLFRGGVDVVKERNPWNTTHDYNRQFTSWKEAARRIRGSGE